MKQIKVLSVLAIISLMSVTGCGRRANSDAEDPTKAQLTVSTFEGGVGDQWLKNAAALFQEMNKDRDDFQEGRTGVQIHIKTDRSAKGAILENSDLYEDVYFTEGVNYYTLTNQGKLADITDVITTPNPDDGNKKIIDKIDNNLLSFMNRADKYYAVPFYDCVYGIIYDKDLFEQKSFYMKNDGSFTNKKAEFGTGPNGVAGDWDDGLPKTYAQFAQLINRMKTFQVTPFTYSADIAPHYTSRALCSYWSDDEGYEQANLNYTFSGTATNIVTNIVAGKPVTETVVINENNGYKLKSQAGIYNALNFARNILTTESANYRQFASNYDVQSAFVNYKYIGGSKEPIAMMFEGPWWENEAEQAFDEARSRGADSFNYGFMPIPKVDESKIGDATYVNLNESFGFINANSEHMKLAKEFFAFLHTDAQMRAFTVETNMTRGLKYSFTDAEKEAVSSFAKDLIAIKESEHVKILYPYSGKDFFVNNSDTFSVETWNWSTVDWGNTKLPLITFIGDNSITAEEFFTSHVSSMTENDWGRIIR